MPLTVTVTGRCGCRVRLMAVRRRHHDAKKGNFHIERSLGSGEHRSGADR
jgi:hypothetical protein